MTNVDRDKVFLRYRLIQVVPTNDFLAVYSDEIPDGSGALELITDPIDALGVAKVYEHRLGCKPEWSHNAVVGLHLENGYFDICDTNSNFAGLVRKGGDVANATGCLPIKLCEKLKGWDEQPQEGIDS